MASASFWCPGRTISSSMDTCTIDYTSKLFVLLDGVPRVGGQAIHGMRLFLVPWENYSNFYGHLHHRLHIQTLCVPPWATTCGGASNSRHTLLSDAQENHCCHYEDEPAHPAVVIATEQPHQELPAGNLGRMMGGMKSGWRQG